MQPISSHWADQTAVRIIGVWGDRDQYVVASGITPSGTVHIGNFREVITVDLVARALRKIGKNVRFLYSWDDFDTLRKVPVNLPNQEMLTENLRHSISRIPDPYGKEESYAAANIKRFESELDAVGIKPEFIYQHTKYGASEYAEQIKIALDNKDKIRAILDEHRSKPLDEDWLPTTIYCEKCDRDQMEYERYEGDYKYGYKCELCSHEAVTDIRTTANLKLNWRTDWPMRWAYEKVDFEPGGKDHSSDGGSFDTAKNIVEQVWGRKPPVYLQYDFVSIKGMGGKMSSSKGNLISLAEALEIFDGQMVRWIFAVQRPNHDFSIAFDQDVIKLYDEFDRAESAALGPEPEGKAQKKWAMTRRVYELSSVDEKIPSRAPYRPPYRELCNRLQICGGDVERAIERYYTSELSDPSDRELFVARANRAWTWLQKHAPEEFRYAINKEPVTISMADDVAKAVAALKNLVSATDLDAIATSDLNQKIYDVAIKATEVDAKEFFRAVYQKLISRDQGPRLPGFVKEIGAERLLRLL